MATHFNKLTPGEDERLALLSEECAEVIKAVAKIQRHGYESVNPDDDDGFTNRQSLQREIGDVFAAMHLLIDAGDIRYERILEWRRSKEDRVRQYLHHQGHV